MKKKKLAKEGNYSVSRKNSEEMDEILGKLKEKLAELEELKKRLEKEDTKRVSAKKTREMLEEITVPPLHLIKEPKKKRM